jgi:hypothetical protein
MRKYLSAGVRPNHLIFSQSPFEVEIVEMVAEADDNSQAIADRHVRQLD